MQGHNANKIRHEQSERHPHDRSGDTGVQCVSDIDVNGTLMLGSATYVIDSGNFQLGAQANISCTGCTIILTNSDSGSAHDRHGRHRRRRPDQHERAKDAAPMTDILFYQDRRATESDTIVNKINGNSDSMMAGAFYFPNQQLQINGTAGLDFNCAQFVSYVVEFAGNGSINNTCTGGYGDNEIMGQHVRLVA